MKDIIISTGDLKQDYTIIDTLFAMDSSKGGVLFSANPGEAFKGVKAQLVKACKAAGGNAIINCQFEYRVAVSQGLMGSKQVFEIFAYGTAVKVNE